MYNLYWDVIIFDKNSPLTHNRDIVIDFTSRATVPQQFLTGIPFNGYTIRQPVALQRTGLLSSQFTE